MNYDTQHDGQGYSEVSRRRFLELGGAAAAVLGVGAGEATGATGDAAASLDGGMAAASGTVSASADHYYVGPRSDRPTAPPTGTMYFETDTGEQHYYDGGAWRSVGRSTGAWNVVDVVEAGGDPTGTEPVDDVLAREYTGSEVFYFPAGEYLFAKPFVVRGEERVGFVGRPHATLKTAPEFGWAHQLIDAGTQDQPMGEVYVRDVTIDLEATTNVHVGGIETHFTRQLDIDNVTVSANIGKWKAGLVTSARGKCACGRVNMDLSAGSRKVPNVPDHSYQPIGVLVEKSHEGRLVFEDCDVGPFPNNGLYASQGPGRVDVVGGRFWDSHVANVRVGSNSSVRGARVSIDNSDRGYANTVGIKVTGSEGNVVIDNTRIESTNTSGEGILLSNDGPVTVRDTRIDRTGYTVDYAVKVSGESRVGRVVLDNVTVTDDLSSDSKEYAVAVMRPRTLLRGCSIRRDDPSLSGVIVFPDAAGTVLEGSVVDVGNYPLAPRAPDITLKSNNFPRGKRIPLPARAAVEANTFDNDGLWLGNLEEGSFAANVGVRLANAGVTDTRSGGQRTYRFPHGLDVRPDDGSVVSVQAATADAAAPFAVDVDATDVVVTYAEAPPASATLRWRFDVRYRP